MRSQVLYRAAQDNRLQVLSLGFARSLDGESILSQMDHVDSTVTVAKYEACGLHETLIQQRGTEDTCPTEPVSIRRDSLLPLDAANSSCCYIAAYGHSKVGSNM